MPRSTLDDVDCQPTARCRSVLAHQRQLCRHITRPALANERVQTNAAEQVVLKLQTQWRDGTTHLVMSPLKFMQRLAALVPQTEAAPDPLWCPQKWARIPYPP